MDAWWYIAARSAELRKKPRRATILGRPVVLFREPDGRPAALEDRCAHRGAALSEGSVTEGTVACPYHGWRYSGDGRVAAIPSMPERCPIPEHLRVVSYPCLEQDGYVWVSLARSPAVERPHRFLLLGERGWTTFRMTTLFRAPVEACLENFLDCPHATTVHESWFRSPTARTVRAVVRSLADGAEAEYFDEPREKSVVWTLLSPKGAEMKHIDRFIAPNTSEVDYRFSTGARYVITSSCTPVEEATTLVHTVITFRFGPFSGLVRLLFEPLARRIIRQDVEMLDRLQMNTRRFEKPRQAILAQDLLAPYILKWRHALESGAAPPPAGQEHHVEMRL
ncbi:MAG: Rieske 2Fe-2S domain-containing protein [Bryobacteraceae bacterium]